jgi:tripartite-type tricarboxylate transporter receptor subunit TctC
LRKAFPTAVLIIAMLVTGAAQAQPAAGDRWPTRPIRFIVPFTAGSSSDIVARIVGQKLGERLGQSIVVDNRVGASGNIGTEAVARAEPDGYTIGLANASTHAVAPSLAATLPYDPVKDFVPVAMIGASPFVMAVYPGVPAKTVQELIALAKDKPKTLSYASAGPASLAHLSGALFEKMAGIELIHVPYRGSAQSVLDLVEGRVQIQFGTLAPTLPLIRDGKVRALAITGGKRNATLPDVPTIAESGLPGYESSLWAAIVMPAGTPPGIVSRLNREVVALLNDPEIVGSLGKQGLDIDAGTPEALAARIRADVEKWRDIVQKARIRQ